ncbi:hypothetical protein ACIBG5_43150 [Kribbella sp. NPDC050241]|uniref:hypothetical protein n=1 Tax=Kribbella sp. NPDC050241 TaxID=3364115 RepID=UPI0037B600B8
MDDLIDDPGPACASTEMQVGDVVEGHLYGGVLRGQRTNSGLSQSCRENVSDLASVPAAEAREFS